MSRSLIVLPDDSAQSILDAIAAAKQSLSIKMFLFSDPAMIAAVIAAQQRGVKARVMLNPARRSGEPENEETRKKLEHAGVEVKDSNPDFDVTHEKSMVVDEHTALVQSFNWDVKNLTETRDYGIFTKHGHEVAEILECFEADWHRKGFDPGEDSHLIWCNLNGRNRIARFIDTAKDTLFVENERYQDEVIIERMVRAAARGVKLHVLARPAHTLKTGKLIEGIEGLRILKDVGAKIHKVKHLKLHGKMLYADQKRAVVGSINLAPGSFDSRRELAIEVDDDHVVKRLHKVVEHDWEHSRPLDLTDEGLLADLKEREAEVSEKLALDADKGHKKKG
jgi:phosphatidylserine/phosphatidylglycerophosphate/cardiolipin synthase-like enzyme